MITIRHFISLISKTNRLIITAILFIYFGTSDASQDFANKRPSRQATKVSTGNFASKDYETGFIYDKNYAMNFDECPKHFANNTPIGFGRGANFELCYKAFAILYSPNSKTAVYVAEHLTANTVKKARKLKRVDSFRAEPRLPDDIKANLADYKRSGYDRGHLAPNGDMADEASQYDSFSLANIVPQNREHNRTLWANIESHVRDLTAQYGETYVVTGTAHHGKQVVSLNGVIVPTHLYKAVYIPSENISAVYYTANDALSSYEIIDGQTLYERVGVMPFGNKARFDDSVFLLDGDQKQQELDVWAYLKELISVLIKLWRT